MAKVSKRGGFSDRNGIKPENTMIQNKEFDKRTRVQLQNMLSQLYREVYGELYYGKPYIQDFFRYVLGTIYSESVDVRIKYDDDDIWNMINTTIMEDEYDDVLTLIEAIIQHWDNYIQDSVNNGSYSYFDVPFKGISIFKIVNIFFEREYIGYRFVDGIITPICDEYEIESLNQALETPFKPVYEHLSKANRLIADREMPDYENSIKESISAVEALCEILTETKGKEASLGNMLKKLEESGVKIHAGLKSAFNKLYGYTSDAKGIRHAGDIGGPASTFEEAKYMLVSCSAFINYLIGVTAD